MTGLQVKVHQWEVWWEGLSALQEMVLRVALSVKLDGGGVGLAPEWQREQPLPTPADP